MDLTEYFEEKDRQRLLQDEILHNPGGSVAQAEWDRQEKSRRGAEMAHKRAEAIAYAESRIGQPPLIQDITLVQYEMIRASLKHEMSIQTEPTWLPCAAPVAGDPGHAQCGCTARRAE